MRCRLKWKPVLYFIAGVSLVVLGIGISIISSSFVKVTSKSVVVLKDVEALKKRVDAMFDGIPTFDSVDCDVVIRAEDEEQVQKAKNWTLPEEVRDVWRTIEKSTDQCKALKSVYVFPEEPFTQEEADFPLAYGAVVHKEIAQVVYMVSAIYQPQNVFVIVVDGDSPEEYKRRLNILGDCFKNIHVLHTTKINWCGYGIVRGITGAVKYLSQMNHPWKYFQYLSGVDLPLKTNLEMVRIFKQLDGAFISEISAFQKARMKHFKGEPPVKLFKASLSATFSRASADFMTNSTIVTELLNFLKHTNCPDESIWTSISGNPDVLPIPGGFNATALLPYKRLNGKLVRTGGELPFKLYKLGPDETFLPTQYYISRYQVWGGSKKCKGKFVAASCVFGIGDLPNLVRRGELVLHKLYWTFQPATYFCLLKNHWRRALDLKNQSKFSAKAYSKIAQVQYLHGVPPEKLMFYRPEHYHGFFENHN